MVESTLNKQDIKDIVKELRTKNEIPSWMGTMSYTKLMAYLQHDRTGLITPKQRYRVIAKTAASYLPEDLVDKYAEKFFQIIWKGWLAPSTPIMSNLGVNSSMAVSCSASIINDTMWDIAYTDYEVAMLSKNGFGTAAFLNTRGGYEDISGGGKTNHTKDWVEKLYNTQKKVSQGGTRRGSCAIYLDFWQKDLLDILPMLKTHELLHLGIICDDSVKEALENGDEEALKIYTTIITWRMRKGKPYIIFIDNARRQDPDCYKKLGLSTKHSNLCVHGETEILTDKGYEVISGLEDQKVKVWNGEEFSETIVYKTGDNQELIKLYFNNGTELMCTPYHKFYIKNGYNKSDVKMVRAHELELNDKLLKHNSPIIEMDGTQVVDAYTQGFFSGDGCRYKNKNHIDLYGEKRELLSHLSYKKLYESDSDKTHNRVRISISNEYQKFYIPSKACIQDRLDWLAGFVDADGTALNCDGSVTIQFSSVEKDFMVGIRDMLTTLGCNVGVKLNKEAGTSLLPDGKGGEKLYDTKPVYRVTVGVYGLYNLVQLGFKPNRLDLSELKEPNRQARQAIKLIGKEVVEGLHDTYCFTEPKRNMGIFNGVLTGNCSEIFLHTDSDHTLSCVLSSMNGSKFDEWKDTDAVHTATIFLDCIAEDLIKRGSKVSGLERVVKSTVKGRALGLGLLGYHTYLQDKSIPFDSFEARMKNNEIFSHLQKETTRASEDLAKLLGEPEWCKGTGRRNTHLTAIAPNTGSAFMVGGTSQGIEPFAANVFNQKLPHVGTVERINPSLLKLLKDKNIYSDDIITKIALNGGSVQNLDELSDHEKNVFKTAFEINQKVIIDYAEHRQGYIDQGQSLNLFFSATEEESWIHEVHKHAFKCDKLKSLYYVRSQSGISADKGEDCEACEG